ncbi:DMT family transporter [Clostridium thermarum]|uniref:DMT family transporter n=1 Tax=Clostridium thermarum TaxID=1716543 RepID=UPI00111CAF2A|nr:DMT family transporter [Clostridium thermarum]
MNTKEVRSNILLLITATIWGFAFVAQRVGLNYVEAFTFNAVRFALGALSLLPLIIYQKKVNEGQNKKSTAAVKTLLLGGLVAGSALFLGSSLQQVGLAYTTAGKAAFITGLYIALVPILGIFLKQGVHFTTWIGVSFAVVGLYFLSVNEDFSINKGDLLQLIGALFWAFHILTIDYLTKKVDALTLSFLQFITCSILSFIVAVSFENISIFGLSQALVPILYGGICSVGIAYTLQVFGQKHAKPSHAAIIMSMEAVFASIGGMLLLNERLDLRGFLGCGLMLTGMLLSQVGGFKKSEEDRKAAA